MSANEIEHSGIVLPRIAKIIAVSPLTLVVKWEEGGKRAGRVDRVDLSPIINTYKIFRPLRKNEALFKTAHLIEDGDVVAWDGPDLELPAEAIESLAEQIMSPQDFVAFLKRNKLTQEAAAAILDYSRRQIGYFVTTGPIPRVVTLACKGYEAEKREASRETSAEEWTKTFQDRSDKMFAKLRDIEARMVSHETGIGRLLKHIKEPPSRKTHRRKDFAKGA
jgi:hypothetical protein